MRDGIKILHLLAQKPGFTGSGIYLRSIVSIADQHNYRQAVICGVEKGEEICFDIEKQPDIYPVYFSSDELAFNVAGMSDVMPYPSTRYQDMDENMQKLWKSAFRKRIKAAINKFKPDLILSHHLWMLSALAKEIAPEIPMIIISHGTALRQKQFCSHIAQAITENLQKADIVLALNKKQRSEIIKQFNIPSDKIVVNGNGYNEKVFYQEKRKKNEIAELIYAGKISYAKGLYELFSALNILYKNGRKFKLTICGSGSGNEEKELKSFAENCGFSIKFTGNVSQNVLADFFRKSDCFLLPSFYEGLPLVVIEALASGLKVIVNDLPGLKEWLGDEICETDMIDFVKLPRLKYVDQPIEKDVPQYINLLAETIDNFLMSKQFLKSACVTEHTWQTVFLRIHKMISAVINESQQK